MMKMEYPKEISVKDKSEANGLSNGGQRQVSDASGTDQKPSKDLGPRSYDVTIENNPEKPFLYTISEIPPVPMLLLIGFQHALLSLSGSLGVILIAADVICAKEDAELTSQMLSSTLFTNSLPTILMVTIGSRLPLYQGAYAGYIIPLLALMEIDPNRCSIKRPSVQNSTIGLHGKPAFSSTVFVGFIIATFISILDSVGDYYACAATCRVPPPPSFAVNRGIAIEGICTILSGLLGCPQATTTYGANIGAIGVTKVSSRSVFIVVGVVYIIFGVIGKVSAIFITIPYPVLGGALIIMMGMFNGVVLSNLVSVDLTSSRNLAIMGIALLMGLLVPLWVKTYPKDIDTGNTEVDFLLKGLLGNPNFSGAIIACFLDNTIPGTLEERGIAAWQHQEKGESGVTNNYVEGLELYDTWLPDSIKNWKGLEYIPFMPTPKKRKRGQEVYRDNGHAGSG